MIIEAKSGKGEKMHVSLDGEYAVTVDVTYWFSCGFSNGDNITEQAAEDFLAAAFCRRAYNKSLDLISRRDYCCRELFDRLKRDFTDDAAQYAVDRVCEMGYIDDEAYAEKLVRHLRGNKHFGVQRIKKELIFRGIDREIAEDAVQALDFDAEQCIIELLETKYAAAMRDEKGVRRTFNTLMRLGYGVSDIKSAMREYGEQLENTGEDDIQ